MNGNKDRILVEKLASEFDIRLTPLLREVKRYLGKNKHFSEKRLHDAFVFAALAHDGQNRKDGTPYIIHPLETVKILASLHMDEDTLITGFLHDVPEDTSFTIEDIEKKFGKKVSFLVDGITKLSKVHYQTEMVKRQVDSLKKLFLHTAEDPRIIIVKLADRLHNMRTLGFIGKSEKRERIALETLEIFVPIANLLGIEEFKSELEELCFRYLHPGEFETIGNLIKKSQERWNTLAENLSQKLEVNLREGGISSVIYQRKRSSFPIYKEVFERQRRLDEFENIIQLRVLVNNVTDCYKALGLIHQNFKPKPATFVDYISVPKVNGYRSLHTSVFGPEGTTLEIQIRTHEMHIENEYGIAACFFQKNDETNEKLMGKDQRAYWAGKIVELQKEQEPDTKFMADLKEDILGDRIFVFTASGDSVDLPQGANCIDFAYHLSEVTGHRAVKADINGQILPLNTVLQNGDTVKIISSETEKGPSRSWLVFVKTTYARNKIKEYFKKISREYKLQTGLELLQKELTRAGLGLYRDIPQRKMNRFLTSNPEFIDNDDILIAIGEGSLTTLEFINFFYPKNSPTLSNIKFFEKHFSVSKLTEKIYTKVAIKIISKDAVGQLERILKVYSDLKVNVLKTRAYLSPLSGDFICSQILAIESFSQVSKVFENLEQLDGVRVVKRMFWQKNLLFLTGFLFTFGVWALHPTVVYYIVKNNVLDTNMLNLFNYFAISLLFFLVFQLKNLTERSFPELRETKSFWFLAFGIATFAFITIFAEINFFQLELNWVILLGLILIVFSYLIAEYIFYRDRHHS